MARGQRGKAPNRAALKPPGRAACESPSRSSGLGATIFSAMRKPQIHVYLPGKPLAQVVFCPRHFRRGHGWYVIDKKQVNSEGMG